MAQKRITQLPLATGPTAPATADAIAIDGVTTRQTTLGSIADVINPPASQAEAEAGVNPIKRMTPLTTAQAIAAQALTPTDVGTTAGTIAAGDDPRIVNAVQPNAALVSALEAVLVLLPTTEPGTPNKLWRNGGFLGYTE